MPYFWKWVSVAIVFAFGISCILGARRMQQAAMKASDAMRVNPFRSYIRSPTYIMVARIIGGSFIVAALLLALALMFGKPL